MQNGRFPAKIALLSSLKESLLYKVSVWKRATTISCKAFMAFYPCKNGWWETSPSTWKCGRNWPTTLKTPNFLSRFAPSASAVTPTEKSSINRNRKTITSFPMSLRWTVYVTPRTQIDHFSSKIRTTICDNFETVVLITNRKLHGLAIDSHINDLERRNSLYFALFHRIR